MARLDGEDTVPSALLALNAGVIVCLILLTLVAGRVYCSVICPLGVFQDVVARLGRGRKKMPYTYSKPKSWLRYGALAVFVLAMLLGVYALVALLDPYAVYGRAAHSFLQPLWMWGNNLLASMAERMDSYAFYSVDVWLKSLPVLIVAAVMLVLVVVLAARNGRTYCNTICPWAPCWDSSPALPCSASRLTRRNATAVRFAPAIARPPASM